MKMQKTPKQNINLAKILKSKKTKQYLQLKVKLVKFELKVAKTVTKS